MKLSMIAAMSSNNVIGLENKMPWHLPEDFKWFRKHTLGKPVLMGKNTFLSIGKPLPNRQNLVLTNSKDFFHIGVEAFNSFDNAIDAYKNASEIMIIGGAKVYEEHIDKVDTLYLTKVNAYLDGDAFFPEVDKDKWRTEFTKTFKANDSNQYDLDFFILNRVK
ncbi:type 3 dihydrofolate reductase [Paraphotobacterium marinum]|uniref:type 3 dihydrofolate reductase n=1 Tax=Paraphotobacterium marinum TaxID=1755811 RepID=UPI0039E7CAF0